MKSYTEKTERQPKRFARVLRMSFGLAIALMSLTMPILAQKTTPTKRENQEKTQIAEAAEIKQTLPVAETEKEPQVKKLSAGTPPRNFLNPAALEKQKFYDISTKKNFRSAGIDENNIGIT